ncbi:hypothetical protein EPN42_00380 [bacterium]|nr:MAG: hypothetical protein EPN42_00380 [bacterium]
MAIHDGGAADGKYAVCLRIADGTVGLRTDRAEVRDVAERVYGRLLSEPDDATGWARIRAGVFVGGAAERVLPHWGDAARIEGALEAMQALVAWGFTLEHRVIAVRGAAVARGTWGVALVGAPTAGKTTLALCAVAAGWTMLADEYVVIERASGRLRAYPKYPLLRSQTLDLLGGYDAAALVGALRVEWAGRAGVTYHGVDLDRLFGRQVWGANAALREIVFLGGEDGEPAAGAPPTSAVRLARVMLTGGSGDDRVVDAAALARRWPSRVIERAAPAEMIAALDLSARG